MLAGSNMVLQQAPQQAIIWGFTNKTGVKVSASLDGGAAMTATSGTDHTWRITLPATPASTTPHKIAISSSAGDAATLENVLFGEVFIWWVGPLGPLSSAAHESIPCGIPWVHCDVVRARACRELTRRAGPFRPRSPPTSGGQSNMAFSLPANTNSTEEVATAAKAYPHVRVMTVGQRTSSPTRLTDLHTVQWRWSSTTPAAMDAGGRFGQFSSVCWFFGKQVADGLGGDVPIGLVSDNWGGTPVEAWSTKESLATCGDNTTDATTHLFNAMINPFTVGPMTLKGFTWYQGESNTHAGQVEAYACRFPAMITAWREAFKNPAAYFGFVQLSTWCGSLIPEMRQTQLEAFVKLKNVGFAVNADHGAGCNIHPPPKQCCGYRLGNSALAIAYGKSIPWQSPGFVSQTFSASPASATIKLDQTSTAGVDNTTKPFNEGTVNCSLPLAGCAWASLKLADGTWVNATISVTAPDEITLTVAAGITLSAAATVGPPVASSYAWGANPMMNVYDKTTGLPLLPFNSSFVPY